MSGKAYRSGLAAVAGVTLVAAVATPARAATSWSVLTTPNRGSIANELYGSAALSATSAWAVGSWYDTNLAAPRTLIERWNGTTWSTVTSPNATQYYNELRDVDASSATDAWAVGYANGSSGVNGMPRTTLAEHWNGTGLYVRGSMVAMFESRVAMEPWTLRVYTAAGRFWGLHESLRNVNHDLPLEPVLLNARRVRFRELTPSDYATMKTTIEALPH